MDTINTIMTRRSIRRFAERAIEEGKIETLIRAAMQAPSANNRQPWHFIVITERRILSAIPEFHAYAKMLHQAAAAVLVCGDRRIEESVEYINSDCSAATENLILAAHDLGLGAVWLGIYPRERRVGEIRRLLEIPSHVVPIALVALGHPAEAKKRADRFQPARVHRNRWTARGAVKSGTGTEGERIYTIRRTARPPALEGKWREGIWAATSSPGTSTARRRSSPAAPDRNSPSPSRKTSPAR